jgi:hypothetical protein
MLFRRVDLDTMALNGLEVLSEDLARVGFRDSFADNDTALDPGY